MCFRSTLYHPLHGLMIAATRGFIEAGQITRKTAVSLLAVLALFLFLGLAETSAANKPAAGASLSPKPQASVMGLDPDREKNAKTAVLIEEKAETKIEEKVKEKTAEKIATADPEPTQTRGPEGQTSEQESQNYFAIWEFRVEKNTLLDTRTIELTLYPYLGPNKILEDVEAARQALEDLYRLEGYPTVLVNIPEQQVSEGLVRLEVMEGRIHRVKVRGSRYFSYERVLANVPSLQAGQVPYLPAVQRELGALNQQTPDRYINPILKPGLMPGTLDVELRIKDEFPLHGSLGYNNRHTSSTTESRVNASLRYANLWQKEHSLGLGYQTSPQAEDEVSVWSFTYLAPRQASNDLIAAYYVDSDSDVSTTGEVNVIGTGQIFGLRYINNFLNLGRYFHSATLGVDYKDFQEDLFIGVEEDELDAGDLNVNTPIDYLAWSMAYSGTLIGQASELSFSSAANLGLRALGNTEAEFNEKRYTARPNYFYLFSSLSWTKDYPWFSYRIDLESQLADSSLVSNEQYSAGGEASVRGYYESQITGDDALAGRFHLLSPQWGPRLSSNLDSLRLFYFIDGAKLRTQNPLPDEDGRERRFEEIYSQGIGISAKAFGSFLFDFSWARAMTRQGDPVENGVQAGDYRVHASLEYVF